MYKQGITLLIPVFNEESRISSTLNSFLWCDEIILLDKKSTDKTVQIAQSYPNLRVIYQDNRPDFNPDELSLLLSECKTKYCMFATASDVIHPAIAKQIRALIDDDSFDYDGIKIPYKGYFLGIYEKYSPWYEETAIKIVKTKLVCVKKDEVHTASIFNIKTIFEIKSNLNEAAYYHLTHESADGIITRHTRYWRGEAFSPEPLKISLIMVIKLTINFLFIKRTFFKGKAGIALAFSFLSYYMITYLYKWDHIFCEANNIYKEIREEIENEWAK